MVVSKKRAHADCMQRIWKTNWRNNYVWCASWRRETSWCSEIVGVICWAGEPFDFPERLASESSVSNSCNQKKQKCSFKRRRQILEIFEDNFPSSPQVVVVLVTSARAAMNSILLLPDALPVASCPLPRLTQF